MAAPSKQQPELSLQGSLFGADPGLQDQADGNGPGEATEGEATEQDTAIEAAARRPRRRTRSTQTKSPVGRIADGDAGTSADTIAEG
ncbi:MAG: hypothetical protein RLZZ459_2098, partial [Cyanobacteriota bacterium]